MLIAFRRSVFLASLVLLLSTAWAMVAGAQGAPPIIVDHESTDLSAIPMAWINKAKSDLHIAYGHTSHGSQITSGMTGLVAFKNNDVYAWNYGGTGGALDLRDSPFSGASDLGNPNRTAWATATRNYLNSHPDVNVIIWSWCGQVSGASAADIQTYLGLMTALENDYPNVKFVYMTGHLDGGGATGNLNVRNNQIRNYCLANNKILYDFADIESYDPDGTVNYMVLHADDNCDYDSDGNGSLDRNWAIDWQNSHTLNVDWYMCSAAHSQPLNGNLKAYAAWSLWARLAGWLGSTTTVDPATTDFDGDGAHDILWRNPSTGSNAIWYLQSNGTSIKSSNWAPTAATGWDVGGVGDLDRDGVPDILWRQPTTGKNAIWYLASQGTSTRSSAWMPTAATSWDARGLADFDRDGTLDVLWRQPSTGKNAIWYLESNGTALKSSAWMPTAAVDWDVGGVADFDRDGVPDVLWRQPSTGKNVIWYLESNGRSMKSAAWAPTVNTSWTVGKVADFDGDGVPDVLWRQPSTGKNVIWYLENNGRSARSAAWAPTVSASWDIGG